MSAKKVWFITGAGRGLGVELAKAALAAGHAVVATGRDREKVAVALGQNQNLLLISDVHLGKVSHFRKHGIAIQNNSVTKKAKREYQRTLCLVYLLGFSA